MKKIVIAPDSFKGSLSSEKVGDAIENGILKIFSDCETIKVAISDGGEGLIHSLINVYNAQLLEINTVDSLFRPTKGYYAVSSHTAIIELACVNGLAHLREKERNPLITSTYGTGLIIREAIKKGYTDIIIGIGGSATNDGGTGILKALGYRFLDKEGNELGHCGKDLLHIDIIDDSNILPELVQTKFTILSDVSNPFYGRQGAAYIFAKQKGADDNMVEELDNGLKNLARVIKRFNGCDVQQYSGAGAAGGVGGALKALLNADLVSGIDFLLDKIAFEETISGADLIITGEGKIDSQSSKGKAPLGVLKYGFKSNIPVIALSGNIEEYTELEREKFSAVFSIQSAPVSLDKAMDADYAFKNLERTTHQLMKLFKNLLTNYN